MRGTRTTSRWTAGLVGAALAVTVLLGPATPAQAVGSWKQVSAGSSTTCGIKTDGTLWCWGDNAHGQLGVNDTVNRSGPTQVTTYTGWSAVSVGDRHVCASITMQRLYCWGDNTSGQLGHATTAPRSTVPVQVTSLDFNAGNSITSVSAGRDHTCSTSNVTPDAQLVHCAGRYYAGSTATTTTFPSRVWGKARPGVTAGGGHSCLVQTDGRLRCWGVGTSGQLGLGTRTSPSTPTLVGTGTNWSEVTAGGLHTCALDAGTAYCWGAGYRGQTGNGSLDDTLTPTPIAGSPIFSSLDAGAEHTCGIATGGTAWCWGANQSGQLGDWSTEDSLTVVGIDGPWKQISAGGADTCAINVYDQLYCWGANGTGQLGTGDLYDRSYPTLIG